MGYALRPTDAALERARMSRRMRRIGWSVFGSRDPRSERETERLLREGAEVACESLGESDVYALIQYMDASSDRSFYIKISDKYESIGSDHARWKNLRNGLQERMNDFTEDAKSNAKKLYEMTVIEEGAMSEYVTKAQQRPLSIFFASGIYLTAVYVILSIVIRQLIAVVRAARWESIWVLFTA